MNSTDTACSYSRGMTFNAVVQKHWLNALTAVLFASRDLAARIQPRAAGGARLHLRRHAAGGHRLEDPAAPDRDDLPDTSRQSRAALVSARDGRAKTGFRWPPQIAGAVSVRQRLRTHLAHDDQVHRNDGARLRRRPTGSRARLAPRAGTACRTCCTAPSPGICSRWPSPPSRASGHVDCTCVTRSGRR